MQNIILVIHLLLALSLIGVVLLQRSEGGGLGIGGGGGGATSGRAPATPLGKLTWIFAVAFLITSISLTIISARDAATDSVIERSVLIDDEPAQAEEATGLEGNLVPPTDEDAPATPPKAE